VSLVAVANRLRMPGDMVFDSDGNLYVADQGDRQILEFVALGQPANNISLAPTAFDFGREPSGGSTPVQAFTLTNNSGATLTGIGISFQGSNSGDFQQNSTSCLTTLANNSSCAINVAFTPTTTGARSAALTVMNSVATQQATVSGTGDDYELSRAPGQIQSLTVVAGNTATFNLQATNDAVFMGTVTFECPGNLPAATLCTITPSSASFTGPSQTVPFMIALQTTSRTKVPGTEVPPLRELPRTPPGALPFPVAVCLALLLSLVLIILRRRARRPVGIYAVSVLVVVAAMLGGCHHKSLTINGTPAGTTDLIVQGTAQNATRGVPIQLVVQ
jgi:trimeric autotransporter adhesin